MNSELAKRVTDLRLARGWSQRELGRRAGIKGATISKLESGSTSPEANTIVRIALALDEDPQELMRVAGKLPEHPPPSSLEDEVLENFRRLDDHQQVYIADLLSDLVGAVRPEYAPAGDRSRPDRSAAGEGREEQADYGSAIESVPDRSRSDQVVRQINEDMLHDQWHVAPTVMEEGQITRVLAFLIAQFSSDKEERAKENDTHPGQE